MPKPYNRIQKAIPLPVKQHPDIYQFLNFHLTNSFPLQILQVKNQLQK